LVLAVLVVLQKVDLAPREQVKDLVEVTLFFRQ
jgi:hypothetical protein